MDATLIEYTPLYLRNRARQTRAMGRTSASDATLAMLEQRAVEYELMAALKENSAPGTGSGAK